MIQTNNALITLFEENSSFTKSLIQSNKTKQIEKGKDVLGKTKIVVFSLLDLFILCAKFFRIHTKLIFIAPNQIQYEIFLKDVDLKDAIIINYHHTKLIRKIHKQKVYNLGIILGLILRIFNSTKSAIKLLNISNFFYVCFLKMFKIKQVYTPCYYDYVAFSLIMEKNRTFSIIEVQHGTINNFFPYTRPTSFKLVDEIWVNNLRTKKYLENNLYKDVQVIINLKQIERKLQVKYNFTETILLYCSSIEINGLHPVILDYLTTAKATSNTKLLVRLHPREKMNVELFRSQLTNSKIAYSFDDSADWTLYAESANLIVISPWSSVIEDAYELGIKSIVIDDFGKKRFQDIIDNKLCFFTNDLKSIL